MTSIIRALRAFTASLVRSRWPTTGVKGTEQPTAQWTAQQLGAAFPWEPAPTFLRRAHAAGCGEGMPRHVTTLGVAPVLTAPRSPWQHAYAKRLSGSIRRECLEQVRVFSAGHRRRLRPSYFHYSHRGRTQLSLAMDCPDACPGHPPEQGAAVAFPEGGITSSLRADGGVTVGVEMPR